MFARFTVTTACAATALLATTALGDVSGSSSVTGSWTSTGSYSSTITLADPGGDTTITDITVGVDIDHTWSSDVSMTLMGPGGSVVFNANQGSSADYDSTNLGTYTWNDAGGAFPGGDPVPNLGPIATSNPLNSAFSSSDGIWTLIISDTTGGDGAFIGGWNLSLTTVPAPGALALLGLGVAFPRRRRSS